MYVLGGMCQYAIDMKKFRVKDNLIIKVEIFYESGSRLICIHIHAYTHVHIILVENKPRLIRRLSSEYLKALWQQNEKISHHPVFVECYYACTCYIHRFD